MTTRLQTRDNGDHILIAKKQNGEYHFEGSKDVFLGYSLSPENSHPPSDSGIFLHWKTEHHSITGSNDFFGFYPAFYHASENLFCISNNLLLIADQLTKLDIDDNALAFFLRAGFYLNDTTPFQNIRALPPNSEFKWQNGRFTINSKHSAPNPKSSLSRADAVKRYGELFQHTVEKYHDGHDTPFSVPLSGGRDSRHILFALLRTGAGPESCLTLNKTHSAADPDIDIAQQICHREDIPHTIISSGNQTIQREFRKNCRTHLCTDEHSWLLPIAEHIDNNNIRLIYDGIGGDVLSAGLFLTEERLQLYQQQKYRDLANNILGEESNLPCILTKSGAEKWSREKAVQITINELRKHADSCNPVGQFYFWNRTRREIALSPWSIMGKHCTVIAPYLDYDIYQFLSNLPAEYFIDHQFHTEAIQSFYPEFADIPFEKKEPTHKHSTPILQRLSFAGSAVATTISNRHPTQYINQKYLFKSALKSITNSAYGSKYPELINKFFYIMQTNSLT